MIRAVIFDMYETLITVFNGGKPYYSEAMAADAGVPLADFRAFWRSTEQARTLGTCDLPTALRMTLDGLGIQDQALLNRMVGKRLADQTRIFSGIRPEVIAMLTELKAQGIRIGLISNCYPEEADLIRRSVLVPFFDAMLLSCEQGVSKPSPEIFRRCTAVLDVLPGECLYVGDGGSNELECAREEGMTALQACWFMQPDEPDQPCQPLPDFPHAWTTGDVMTFLRAL